MSTSTSHSPTLPPSALRPLSLPRHQHRHPHFPAGTDRRRCRVCPEPDAVHPVSAGRHVPALVREFFASRDFMQRPLQPRGRGAHHRIRNRARLLAALALARGGLPGSRVITAIMLSPLMLPAILTGLALFQSYVLLDVGRPLWGLVLGHTLVSIPYVVRTTLAVLQNFDTRLEEAACNLGAGPLRTYFEVTLPLTKPGVMAGAVFRLHRLLRPVSGIAFPGLSGPRNAADHLVQLSEVRSGRNDRRGLGGLDPARRAGHLRARSHGRAQVLRKAMTVIPTERIIA